jgi:hypothetical protein
MSFASVGDRVGLSSALRLRGKAPVWVVVRSILPHEFSRLETRERVITRTVANASILIEEVSETAVDRFDLRVSVSQYAQDTAIGSIVAVCPLSGSVVRCAVIHCSVFHLSYVSSDGALGLAERDDGRDVGLVVGEQGRSEEGRDALEGIGF